MIAREWQWLQPLRSFCELNGIPVQMAREESAQFWHQRETQALSLYYVAMTRARLTLLLARLSRGQRFIDALPASAALWRRPASALPAPAAELSWCYQQLNPGEVDLGFAGRSPSTHRVHQAIAALGPDSTLHLQLENQHWRLRDAQGNRVGQLAASYTPPPGMACIAARVAAIIVRRRSDSPAEYLDQVRCERWEVVLPELVFAPAIREA